LRKSHAFILTSRVTLGFVRRMKRLAVAIVTAAVAVVTACGGGSPTQPSPGGTATPQIVAFGDSLTAGFGIDQALAYPALLQQRVRDAGYAHRVINEGVSGDTTADGLRRMNASLVPGARVLILALGANDGLQGLPVDTVQRNLSAIIEAAQQRQIRVLLCGMETPPLYGWDYTLDFHQIYPDLAARFNVRLMPFLLAGVVGDPALNLADGFHPNTAGHRRIAENMWPHLEPLLR
jgi:acyl-CoA thioesterase-1